MPEITFLKMHANGNDFMIIDQRQTANKVDKAMIVRLSDRHFGVGFDQFITLNNSNKADLAMQIYNADGSEAEACGNATRCIAKLVLEEENAGKKITIDTKGGILEAWKDGNEYTINMGSPRLKWNQIPLSRELDPQALPIANCQTLPIAVSGLGQPVAISMGNPHLIFFVPNIDAIPLQELGPHLEKHEFFPNRTNVDIAQIIDEQTIRLRVWERSTGETLACGSGACATVVASQMKGYTKGQVEVHQLGGKVKIAWPDKQNVLMTGGGELVFSGTLKS